MDDNVPSPWGEGTAKVDTGPVARLDSTADTRQCALSLGRGWGEGEFVSEGRNSKELRQSADAPVGAIAAKGSP